MNPKITKQTLMCELTEKERREYGIALATKLGDMEEIEAEKKKNADHFKDRIAGLQASCDELSRKVRDGKEWREVECQVLLGSPDREHKQTIRLDTGETIRTERMTAADLQVKMPLVDNVISDEVAEEIEREHGPEAEPLTGGVEIVDGDEELPPLEDAPEHIELLTTLDAAKGVAKRTALIEEFITSFGTDQIALVVEIGKRNGFDEKKLAHLAGFIPAESEDPTSTATDY